MSRSPAQPDANTLYEAPHWAAGLLRVAGVDEVGRGPLSGPVLAAAVILDPARPVLGLRDSKRCSKLQIDRLAATIHAAALAIGFGASSAAEIDQIGIVAATERAMYRALARVAPYDAILVDGRPVAGLTRLGVPCLAIVRGDAQVTSIAAAAIVAKQLRDRLMLRLAGRYPLYGWERNVGYGSAEHRAALGLHGLTPHHRYSFASKFAAPNRSSR